MEKYTKMVLMLALLLATLVGGLEGRDIKGESKPYQPQNFPGLGGIFGNPNIGGGSGLGPGFGLGQPVFGGAFPGFGNLPGFPGGGLGGRKARVP